MRHPFAAHGQPVVSLRDLALQHPQCEPRAGLGEAAEMGVGIGSQSTGQASGRAIQPLPRDRKQFARGGQRPHGGANSLRRPSWPRCQHSIVRRASAATSTNNSLRTGTAISAAAVGVGARLSAAKSISVMSVSWPTAEISGDHAVGSGTDHDLLVERPQVFQRSATARDDQKIRPRKSCHPPAAR